MEKKPLSLRDLTVASTPAGRRMLFTLIAGIGILWMGYPLPVHGAILDTSADLVIGQLSLTKGFDNLVDGRGLDRPFGVALDKSVVPNRLYISDSNNHRILGYGNVNSFASGNPADLVIGQPDLFSSGCNTGGLSASSLCSPLGIAVDNAGNLYVVDSANSRVLEYNAPFTSDTIADRVFGQGGSFSSNTCNNGGISANSLCKPQGIALDNAGNLYIGDSDNNRVLEYQTPLTSDAVADRVFGQGGSFTSNACNGGGITADSLCLPIGIVVDQNGNLYVVDVNNSRVLEYDTPLTSDTTADRVFGQGGSFASNACNSGGVTQDSLCFPEDAGLDGAGNLYVVDTSNNRILVYNAPLSSDTIADQVFGQGGNFTTKTCNSGGVTAGSLCGPVGIGIDSSETVYVADFFNNRVLAYNAPLASGTIADKVFGQVLMTTPFPNFTDAQGFFDPFGVAVDRTVVPNRLYVADTTNSRILGYKDVLSLVNGQPADLVIGQPDFFSAGCNTGGVSASSLCFPVQVAVDPSGNLYVADFNNNRVLEYDSPFTTDTVADRVFGQGGSFTTNACNNGGLNANSLCIPLGIAVDSLGNLYVADSDNDRILVYNAPLTTDTTADQVFGQGGSFTSGVCNNGGLSADSLCSPWEIAVDNSGNLFVADRENNRALIYKAPLDTTADVIFGQAGNFTSNTCNSVGITAGSLCSPQAIFADNAGNVYIADSGNHRVLIYTSPLTTDTLADLVLGQGGNFTTNIANNGGISPDSLFTPVGLAVDDFGRLYVADNDNNRILIFFPLAPSLTSVTPSVVVQGIRTTAILTGSNFQSRMNLDLGPDVTVHSFTQISDTQALVDFTPHIAARLGAQNLVLNSLNGQSATLDGGLQVTRNPSLIDSSDFDRDRRPDLAIWRPTDGTWYIQGSFLGPILLPWGIPGDVPVPGDYDGDRRTDLAVWRPGEGIWYLSQSLLGFKIQPWGLPGDIPLPRDYDGDRRTDLAVWRPAEGTWYVLPSRGGFKVQAWGVEGDIPVPGDYDGDSVADLAVWRPDEGTWYILFSSGGLRVTQWGQKGDIPVPADYNGDGITDMGIWRPTEGKWYIFFSKGGFRVAAWGVAGDIPVPTDYNRDGRADLAVWRPSDGKWYISLSSGGFRVIAWGIPGDIPVTGTGE